MEVKVTNETSWKRALNAARRTVGKEPLDKEPSDAFKLKSLIAEHSHIKLVEYLISFKDLKTWVGIHILRHPFVLPFIHSQRDDRRDNPIPRDEMGQGTPNDQDFVMNAQTLINVSRKRLCGAAAADTRKAWKMVKKEIEKQEPIMASVMVPNCIYRGFCPEGDRCCGYVKTKQYQEKLKEYRELCSQV